VEEEEEEDGGEEEDGCNSHFAPGAKKPSLGAKTLLLMGGEVSPGRILLSQSSNANPPH